MYQYKNILYAGINNEKDFANWLQNNKPDTGYVFIRKLDNFIMGSTIHLGIDWSEVHHNLDNKPRIDKEEYYEEVPIKIIEERVAT